MSPPKNRNEPANKTLSSTGAELETISEQESFIEPDRRFQRSARPASAIAIPAATMLGKGRHMNFYYGADKISHDEFREWCNAAQTAHARRNAVFALFLGVTYLVIGKYYWLEWMAECSTKSPMHNLLWQAIWGLAALVVGPVLLGGFNFLSKISGNWPCCPTCGKKICKLLPTVATKRCPHCNTLAIEDQRKLSEGFELPPSLEEAIAKGAKYASGGNGTQSLQSMRIVAIGIPIVVSSFFLVGIRGNLELEPLMEKSVLIMGFAIIGFSALAPLTPIEWMIKILKLLRIYPTEKNAFCPECGVVPCIYTVRMSGCCSDCGAKLAELPADTGEFATVDWHKLKHYWMWNVRGGIAVVLLLYPFFFWGIKSKDYWVWVVFGAIFLFHFIILRKRKLEAQIPKKCQNCQRDLSQSVWPLLYYRRCLNCRRKLVRDDDAGKGAVK